MSVSLYTSQVPTSLDEVDSVTGSLGTAMFSDVAGTISALRYYKGNSRWDGLSVPVGLYSATGTLLASGARTQLVGDAVGWVTVPLTVPYHTAALTTFVAAYQYGGLRGYVATAHGYATDRTNGVLHADTDAETGPPALHNGLYIQPSASGVSFPTQMFQNTDYFVDVLFDADSSGTPATGGATLALTATGVAAAPESGSATLALTATGNASAGGVAAGGAALALTASGTPSAPETGGAVLDLHAEGSATGTGVAAGSATLDLHASGTAAGRAAGGGATLALATTGTLAGMGVAAGMASLALIASGAPSASATALAVLDLVAAGTPRGQAVGMAVLGLLANGVAAAQPSATAHLDLVLGGIVTGDGELPHDGNFTASAAPRHWTASVAPQGGVVTDVATVQVYRLPLETCEFVGPFTFEEDGVPIQVFQLAVVADRARPTVWEDPLITDKGPGVMVGAGTDHALTLGLWGVWLRADVGLEKPVIEKVAQIVML